MRVEGQNNRSRGVPFISESDPCHNLANVWQDGSKSGLFIMLSR